MEYTHTSLPILVAIGALFVFVSCAARPVAQTAVAETATLSPSERLPTPSRSLPPEPQGTSATAIVGQSGLASAPAPTPAPAPATPALAPLPPWSASPPFSSYDFSKPLPMSDKSGHEYAILAGGCFWCLEAVFENIPGVVDVVSGYTGGTVARPSYEYVSTGGTGHAEAVRITFDPSKVRYEELLKYFWKIHDPTTKDRQGYDVGSQYRSAIYYLSEAQRAKAAASIEEQRPLWQNPIVTELAPAGDFWIAEEYHQDFFRRNPDYGYCSIVIAPKLKKAGFGE